MRVYLYILAILLAVVTAGLHAYAIENFLYWKYLWFDFIVHLFAGAMVGLPAYLVLSRFFSPKIALGYAICAAIGVGALWEGFEYYAGLTVVGEPGFIPDTLQDFLADTLGGFGSAYLARTLLRKEIR